MGVIVADYLGQPIGGIGYIGIFRNRPGGECEPVLPVAKIGNIELKIERIKWSAFPPVIDIILIGIVEFLLRCVVIILTASVRGEIC